MPRNSTTVTLRFTPCPRQDTPRHLATMTMSIYDPRTQIYDNICPPPPTHSSPSRPADRRQPQPRGEIARRRGPAWRALPARQPHRALVAPPGPGARRRRRLRNGRKRSDTPGCRAQTRRYTPTHSLSLALPFPAHTHLATPPPELRVAPLLLSPRPFLLPLPFLSPARAGVLAGVTVGGRQGLRYGSADLLDELRVKGAGQGGGEAVAQAVSSWRRAASGR